MPCNHCYPDVYDYGFDLNDERGRVLIDFTNYEEEDEDYDDVEPVWAVIRIERDWFTCRQCETGTDYRCLWGIKYKDSDGNSRNIDNLPSEHVAFAVARALRDDLDHSDETLKRIREWEREEAEYQAICASERRMGC